MKKQIATLVAILGMAALGLAQDVRTKPILLLDDIGATTATFTVTAGSDGAPAGFDLIIAPRVGQKHVLFFDDVLAPNESIDVSIDGLTCDTAYHFGVVMPVVNAASPKVTQATDPCP